jgi:hypothetical protein
LNPERLPEGFRVIAIELPDKPAPKIASATVMLADPEACRRFGDSWAVSRRAAALVVASVVNAARLRPRDLATQERNGLLPASCVGRRLASGRNFIQRR